MPLNINPAEYGQQSLADLAVIAGSISGESVASAGLKSRAMIVDLAANRREGLGGAYGMRGAGAMSSDGNRYQADGTTYNGVAAQLRNPTEFSTWLPSKSYAYQNATKMRDLIRQIASDPAYYDTLSPAKQNEVNMNLAAIKGVLGTGEARGVSGSTFYINPKAVSKGQLDHYQNVRGLEYGVNADGNVFMANSPAATQAAAAKIGTFNFVDPMAKQPSLGFDPSSPFNPNQGNLGPGDALSQGQGSIGPGGTAPNGGGLAFNEPGSGPGDALGVGSAGGSPGVVETGNPFGFGGSVSGSVADGSLGSGIGSPIGGLGFNEPAKGPGDALGVGRFAGFDRNQYLAANQDVAAAGVDPIEHYLSYGAKENRALNLDGTKFDKAAYLAKNADVAASGMDPIAHYLEYGAKEGRLAQTIGPGGAISPIDDFLSAGTQLPSNYAQLIDASFAPTVGPGAAVGTPGPAATVGTQGPGASIGTQGPGQSVQAFDDASYMAAIVGKGMKVALKPMASVHDSVSRAMLGRNTRQLAELLASGSTGVRRIQELQGGGSRAALVAALTGYRGEQEATAPRKR